MECCDNIYDKIQELLGSIPGNVTILEEQIDADLQTEYYEYSKNIGKSFDREKVLKDREIIFLNDIDEGQKKQMIAQLACIDSVEAYRTLERYIENKETGLKDWATLAFKESRLLIESKLLDENQVLISTGLGGKGLRLRYYTVLISDGQKPFTVFEQETIKKELEYSLRKYGGEPEKINFDRELCSALSIIPLQAPVQRLFDEIVAECNHYGNFLNSEYIITNVRVFSNQEIREMINQL
jgi:hypothetical protein